MMMTNLKEMITRVSIGDVERVKEIIKRAPFLIHIKDVYPNIDDIRRN